MVNHEHVLAVDIGGTYIRLGVIDAQGELHGSLLKKRVPFRGDGVADPDGLIDLLEAREKQCEEAMGRRLPLGISLCGNVDPKTGEAVLVANLHWQNVPFGPQIHERLGVPVYIATDVREAALAEAVWGAGQDVDNFFWLTVGTGYGGYLFLNGRLYGGAHGFAGNVGHTPLDEKEGYLCGCGQRGCVETFVAGPAIARAGQIAVEKQMSPILAAMAGGGEVTCRMVFEAAEAGDEAAQRIMHRVIRLIAMNMASTVNLLDLEMIILGGGVANAAPWFRERINERVRDFLMTVEARRDLQIVPESFPNSALWGAAAHVFSVEGVLDPSLLEG
ncbi:MAG: ROK family protein [Anaerolineae bacterium]|jgi:glucokinase